MQRGINILKKEYEGREVEYNNLAKKVTLLYANSRNEYSQKEIGEELNITTSAVRKLMDYAIITDLVTLKEAEKVLNKSILNQQKEHSNAGGSSIKYHKKLIKKRFQYIANSYEPIAIMEVIDDVLYRADGFKQTMKRFNIESEWVLRYLLQRAIVENICSDKETDELVRRSFKNNQSEQARKFFLKLVQERIKNKKK
ncbi:MAG: hypothetical protein J6M60_02080 [Clostridia bacterium]|nr:hypothetical protein [Clostridia bacterium]